MTEINLKTGCLTGRAIPIQLEKGGEILSRFLGAKRRL